VWHHTWQKNWVNCAVLTGNSAGLRTVLSSHLSHRELCSSLRESQSFLSLPADTMMASSQGTQQNWQKTDKPDGKPVLCQKTFSLVFCAVFFTQLTLNLLNPSILAPPRNANTPNAEKSHNTFGNADRVLSFYLTAQCRNTEHVFKQSWL
jgi:hypothetical protein